MEDSRSITGKNYKCVKATINTISKLRKQEKIAAENKNNEYNINVFNQIKDTKITTSILIDKLIKLCGDRIIDLLLHIPVNYELWHKVKNFSNISNGECCCIETEIIDIKTPKLPFYISKQKHIPTIIKTITIDGYKLDLDFFNTYPNMLNKLKIGSKLVCQGRLAINSKGQYLINHPHFPVRIQNETGCTAIYKLNQLENDGVDIDNLKIDNIVPIYSLTDGLKQNQLVAIIDKILKNNNLDFSIFDNCDYLLKKTNIDIEIPTTKETLKRLHFPKSINDIKNSSIFLKKMSFLELLSFQYAISKARTKREENNGLTISGNGKIKEIVLKNLPFTLTEDQVKCLNEIYKDQGSEKKMFRLLQGDVGSGKTIVALMSAINAIESGYKVVIMAPTAILAKQHFYTIQKFCFGTGIQSELLIGETKQKVSKDIITRLNLGQIDILVGTHTLFQNKLELPKNIGLFIIDEQHNFGVMQRVNLISKCGNADILMMTATPIPRTMVMGLYGDITISCINNKPADRLPIETKVLNFEEKYTSLVEAINRKIKLGEKIYWICPLVEESEKLEYIDVNTRAKELSKIINKEKIGILHGKMSQEKKDEMMLEFKNGKYNLLIATTVIEVGIDVPDATIIVIENAEKFGLSQLHQLRGRVGRGNKQSYCFLLYSNNISEIGKTRLNILKNNDNGFKISEFDLKIRGGGTLLSKKQSGFKTMNFVDFVRDKDVVYLLNQSHIENIEISKIKPILDLFSYSKETEIGGAFNC